MKRRKRVKGILPTVFTIRDCRLNETGFRTVDRATYKRTAREHSESGMPIRTGTEYHNGRPVKRLTIDPNSPGLDLS